MKCTAEFETPDGNLVSLTWVVPPFDLHRSWFVLTWPYWIRRAAVQLRRAVRDR